MSAASASARSAAGRICAGLTISKPFIIFRTASAALAVRKSARGHSMRRLEMILSRLAWFVPTLAGLVIIVFLISNVIPTDPVRVLLGENATSSQIEAMRIKLGYDQPLWVQLARHFGDILSGN